MREEFRGQTRKVTGKSYEDCRLQLYEKYGTNYTILDRRQMLEGGFFGIGQREVFEVTYELKNRDISSDVRPSLPRVPPQVADEFERNKNAILKNHSDSVALSSQVAKTISEKMTEIETAITKQLQSLSVTQGGMHETIRKIEELLAQNEFSFSYITMMTERIRATFSLDALDDFTAVERKVVDWIGETISITPEKTFRPPHVVVIVGPTGVGKTTTIAKLAAKEKIETMRDKNHTPDMCIMTIDSMRVGAIDQLSKYGGILKIGVQKAETAQDVRQIYEEHKDHVDSIYIDTGGYSPNDSTNIGKMKAVLEVPALNPDVYLALSAPTKARDLEKIMQNYEPFGYQSVIVTKCDETDRLGNVISTLYEKHKSVSYICDGQNAARNLERATVIYFLIRLQGFTIDRIHIEDVFGER
ncbi:MAG: hypothetical protein IJ191_06090 [Treponema sp.]|nr:hypothetical protein [Treponema sp.]